MRKTPRENTSPDSRLPERGQFVIRGAYVMTMDEKLGDLAAGDVHVRDGEVAAVGAAIDAPGAAAIDGRDMVVLPGFIDTHTHLWTSQMRAIFGDTEEASYFKTTDRLGVAVQPADMYIGTRFGAVESLHAGITSLCDFCHNARSPEHVESALKALADTGLRARFLYGQRVELKPTEPMDLANLERLHESWGDRSNGGLITLGLAWRGPLGKTRGPEFDVAKAEFDAARRLGIPIDVHASGKQSHDQIKSLGKGGFLGPDVKVTHASNATSRELKMLAESGVAVSITPFTEMRVGYGLTLLGDYLASGVRLGFGVDSSSLAGNADMFGIMKLLQTIENGRNEDEFSVTPRRLLELATIEGARAIGEDGKIGSIVPGKRADLILIRTTAINLGKFTDNPAHLLVESAQPVNVDTVVIDGRVLKRNGQLVGVDTEKLVQDAQASMAGIFQRASDG